MTSSNRKSIYWRGVRHGLPFVLIVVPFAALFGVVATEAGLNLAEVMGFSVLVVAGAAQLAALQLMVENAPVWIILATALAVNLRMAMYSASLAPYLGKATVWQRAVVAYLLVDQSYTLSIMKYEAEPELTLSERLRYFAGVISPIMPLWYLGTWLGAVAGGRIPPEFALDFAMPITFIAMIAPALRTLAHVAAAFTSVLLALALVGLPYGTGLLLAAVAAMIVGAQVELMLERRRA